MNIYCAQIDIPDTTKALSFAHAVGQWMSYLQDKDAIRSWRLLRRKLGLASNCYKDFWLEIEVDDLEQLDQAFRLVGSDDHEAERLYTAVHQMIGTADFALYRPFPDPERAERMALI